jgi:hypothetical protein
VALFKQCAWCGISFQQTIDSMRAFALLVVCSDCLLLHLGSYPLLLTSRAGGWLQGKEHMLWCRDCPQQCSTATVSLQHFAV